MPSCEARLVSCGGGKLDRIAVVIVGHEGAGVELRIGRIVGRDTGIETRSRKRQLSVFHAESFKLGAWWSDTRVGLGIADGAVGGDVDLLATGHLDGLTRISKGQRLRINGKMREKKARVTYQATIARGTGPNGLLSRRATNGLRNKVGTVGFWRSSANAEDQASGLDESRAEIRGLQCYDQESTILRWRFRRWRGRSQAAVIAAMGRRISVSYADEISVKDWASYEYMDSR